MTICVPTLYFHHVRDDLVHYTNYPPELFVRLLDLISSRYTTVTPKQAGALITTADRIPDNAIILSFDDGFDDLLDCAIPSLLERGLTAVVFPIAGYLGKPAMWNERLQMTARHMTGPALRELNSLGIEIGSHSISHRSLPGLSYAEQRREIRDSRLFLEDIVGVPVTSFSFPYGSYCDDAVQLSQSHYDVAFSSIKSPHIDWATNRHRLRRCYVRSEDSVETVIDVITEMLEAAQPMNDNSPNMECAP